MDRTRGSGLPGCTGAGLALEAGARWPPHTLRRLAGRSGRAGVDAERCRRHEPAPTTDEPDRSTRRLFPLGGAAAGREMVLGGGSGAGGQKGPCGRGRRNAAAGRARVPAGRPRAPNRRQMPAVQPLIDIPASASRTPGRISTAGRPLFASPVDTAAASRQCRHRRTTSRAHREMARPGPGGQVRRFTRAPPTRGVGQVLLGREMRCDTQRCRKRRSGRRSRWMHGLREPDRHVGVDCDCVVMDIQLDPADQQTVEHAAAMSPIRLIRSPAAGADAHACAGLPVVTRVTIDLRTRGREHSGSGVARRPQ